MILLFVILFMNSISIQSKSYEMSHIHSNEFLKLSIVNRRKYEESREIVETNRESCLNEYRQQIKLNNRRKFLSPFCTQYCTETMNCQENDEQSACIDPSWSSRTRKYAAKFERMCYIRFTEILRYEQAESLCQKYGLQLAIIDNSRLVERLKQLNMFNITCQGQCPTAKGYYIGLKRLFNNNETQLKWIWSNNVTWTQNVIDCDNDSYTSYPNANLLCYMENNGQKKMTIWNQNEPNNHRTNIYHTGEDCVEIIANTNQESFMTQIGKLNDIPCTKPTLGAICQKKDLKPTNSEQFKYFAKIIGFNQTEIDENYFLDDLLSKLGSSISSNNLEAILETLESLLNLSIFTFEQAANVLNIIDQLVNITGQIDIQSDSLKSVTNKLLHFLDLFSTKIQTKNEGNTFFEYENLNMFIVNIDLKQENLEWILINNEINSNTIIELNMRVLQNKINDSNSSHIIETIFSNFNLFPQINNTHFGIPISYQITNMNTMKSEEDFIRFQIHISDVNQSDNIYCAYWSFNDNNGTWLIDETCRFIGYVNNYVQCSCNHLTHFALLMLSESKNLVESLSTIEDWILTFVTFIGIFLSIIGLLLTLITYFAFGRLQRNHLHGSLIMLCFSLLFVDSIFIPFAFIQSKTKNLEKMIICTIIAFFFHYFLIASFIWMLIMAIVQYMHFVRVFNSHISHFFMKTSIIGWIIPIIFPLIVVIFGSHGGYINQSRCWINSSILHYITFIIPLSMILFTNLILFGFILKSIYHRDTIVVSYQRIHSKIQMGAALCCFISIGCTWLFAWFVLLQSNFIHELIFCICNSSQGFFIFLFHIYLSKPKREFWQRFIRLKSHQTNLQTISHTKSSTTDQTKISST